MPKQIGSRQIRGKFGQECYYFRKGMQTGLYRGINQQMSARVKSDPEFENTRLYAREFGYAGKLSSLSFLPSRLRMPINLQDNSQGKLTKMYRQMLEGNSAGEFGHRVFVGTNWQDAMVQKINAQCRVDMDVNYPIQHVCTYFKISEGAGYQFTWSLKWDSTLADAMERNNLDTLAVNLMTYGFNAGHYDSQVGAYVDIAKIQNRFILSHNITLSEARQGGIHQETWSGQLPYEPADAAGTTGIGNSVLNRPMVFLDGLRTIGNTSFKQRSLSAFKLLDNAIKTTA